MTLKERHITHRAKKCIYTYIKSELKRKKKKSLIELKQVTQCQRSANKIKQIKITPTEAHRKKIMEKKETSVTSIQQY